MSIDELTRQVMQGFDVVFSIGTTSVFPYIQEPVRLAKQAGKPAIEINPSETVISSLVDHRVTAQFPTRRSERWFLTIVAKG